MMGQMGHFTSFAPEKIPYAIERYTSEVTRLARVLDKRLGDAEWLAGAELSMADIATFPWTRHIPSRGIDMSTLPEPRALACCDGARPGVQRGLDVMKSSSSASP